MKYVITSSICTNQGPEQVSSGFVHDTTRERPWVPSAHVETLIDSYLKDHVYGVTISIVQE